MLATINELDLNEFEVQKRISVSDLFRVNHIINKKKNVIYSVKSIKTDRNTPCIAIMNLYQYSSINIKLNHPSILKFVAYSPIGLNKNQKPIIVNESVQHETLEKNIGIERMSNNYPSLDDTQKIIILYGIAVGMSFLHSNGIIHCDLNPNSIFLDENYYPKIAGFENSNELSQKRPISRVKGQINYAAPEVLSTLEYSKSSDVYSFALLMYEIINDRKPFVEIGDQSKLIQMIKEGKRPVNNPDINSSYSQLIGKCWQQDATKRPTFAEIVDVLRNDSSFITESVDKEEYEKYIKYIDESPSSFDPHKKIAHFEKYMNNYLRCINQIDMQVKNNQKFDPNIDLSKYKVDNDYIVQKQYTHYWIFDEADVMYNVRASNDDINNFFKEELISLCQKANVVSKLNHPAITKCFGYSPIDFKGRPRPVFVNETVNCPLEFEIDTTSNKYMLEWDDTKRLINIYGIAAGMEYLHSHNIIHRDLKPENINLDNNQLPKISGFEISKEIKEISKENKHQEEQEIKIKGTPAYLAPEVYSKGEYSKSSDVYSYSLIVYEIMTNKRPYEEYQSPKEIEQAIVEKGIRPTFDKPIPTSYRQLIERCWSSDPKSRPTFSEITQILRTDHNFITDSIDEESYREYIESIDEYPVSFNSNNRIKHLDDFIKFKGLALPEYGENINFKSIYITETNNISLDFEALNLKNYTIQKTINKGKKSKVYQIIEKETGKFYTAKSFPIYFDMLILSQITKIHSELNHPSIINFIGYSPINFKNKPKPMLVFDFVSNESLDRILEIEKEGHKINCWDDTRKLINIYGIAAGMSYLHSHNVLHCNLRPSNILLDEYLFPKINNFGYSKILSQDSICCSLKNISIREGYFAPEITSTWQASKACDVYSYSLIVYEIITGQNFDINSSNRPKINDDVPLCYRNLIEKCWDEKPEKRPTFDDIVYLLRNDQSFITEKQVDKEIFDKYVDYIDEYPITFGTKARINQAKQNYQISEINKIKIEFPQDKKYNKLCFTVNMETVDLNHYSKKEKVGKGQFGSVYRVIEKETGVVYAAKVSRYSLDHCDKRVITDLSREVEIISQLNHLSIIKYIGYCPDDFDNKSKPTIVQEFAPKKSLEYYIDLERQCCGDQNFDDTKKLINIYGIAAGMKYMHSKNILHRDLKPANIFLDDNLYPKIGDFGLSKVFTTNKEKRKQQMNSGFKGTYAYCPPEVLSNNIYTPFCDVYSYGMIVYEIITDEIPFDGCNFYQLLMRVNRGIRPNIPDYVPSCYKELIQNCWSKTPLVRSTFKDIVDKLEKNPEFITPNVDKQEFYNYIDSLKEYEEKNNIFNQFEQTNIDINIKNSDHENIGKVSDQINDESSINVFDQVNKKVPNQAIENSKNSNQSNLQNIVCDSQIEGFLDMKRFEKISIISKGDIYKIYKIREKETNLIYSAKISLNQISKLNRDDLIQLQREVNIISQVNHPSFLKFIGYSPIDFKNQRNPVIVTELSTNGTLKEILEFEKERNTLTGWDETKKLINIYGIASGMAYLHSNNIILRNLNTENIYLDDYLFPKIGDFGLSSRYHNVQSMTFQSASGLKGTPAYLAPEVFESNLYTKKSDVYAFSFILFEILTNETPFKDLNNTNQLFIDVVVKSKRPEIKKNIPLAYRNLIEKCWSQFPSERPTFDQIVDLLRNDEQFITKRVKKEDYLNYIHFIDESKITFDKTKRILQLDEFIKSKSRICEIEETENLNSVINDLISSKKAKELIEFINDKCDFETVSSVFDKCLKSSHDFFLDLCKEGIALNNPVAYHKYALSFILDDFKVEHDFEKARNLLQKSIDGGFDFSYFILSRLFNEVFNDKKQAFETAEKGAKRNEKYSKCLLGYFIAHGIGTEKNFEKGVQLILETGTSDFYKLCSTDIGIYYGRLYKQEKQDLDAKISYGKKAFKFLEMSFNRNKTKESIKNYGICFLEGIGVQKDIEKAKKIFDMIPEVVTQNRVIGRCEYK